MSIVDTSEILLELGLSSGATDEESAIVAQAMSRAEAAVKRFLKYDPELKSHTEFYPQQNFDYQGRSTVWESEGDTAYLRRMAEAATSELQLQHIPIRASTAIQVFIDYDGRSGTSSDAFDSDSEKTEGTDFWPNYDGVDSNGDKICRDGILRSIGSWPTTPGSVKVIYTAGYSSAELRGEDSVVNALAIGEAVAQETLKRAKKALVLWKKKTGVGHMPGVLSSERLGDYSYSADGSMANRLFGGLFDLMPETRMNLSEFVNWGWSVAS